MAANVQTAVEFWKNFELPRLQKTLDVTAKELANKQDESDFSRKKLLDLSRDFKKNTPEEIRKAVVPLLKSFQQEVDSLCKRSKAAEAAFLTVYRSLIEMPDPFPILDFCHSLCQRWIRNRELEMQNRHLREAIAHSNHHYNGREVTIKLLREKVDDFEESTPEEEPREGSQLEENENDLVEVDQRLQETLKQVAQLQSALESTQSELYNWKVKYDGNSQFKNVEMEIIVNDLDKANQRAALAETEVRLLQEQLVAVKQSLQLADQIQKAPDMERAVDVVARSSLELELAAKHKEISQLIDDIQRLQSTLNTLQESSASKIAQLEITVNEKEKMIVDLGDKLVKQRDYEDIKKELSIMKSVDLLSSRKWDKDDLKKDRCKERESTPPEQDPPPRITKSEVALPNYTSSLPNSSPFSVALFSQHAALKEERPSTPCRANSDPLCDDRKPSPPLDSRSAADNSPEPSPTTMKDSPFTPTDKNSLQKLQEILKHNIDKYANETLNTLNISRCVRELLSVHNIGQRLFAKFVLGLSQGTVSELLSKPKPWDKLTEKGRDSYRKMHAWASDDQCIFMLKALVPRRGKESGCCGPQSFKQDDQGAEERIVQILNEAQLAMMNARNQEQKSPSTFLPNGIGQTSNTMSDSRSLDSCDDNRVENGDHKTSHTNNNNAGKDLSMSPRRSRKYENDDIPQEMVAKIYQEELAKLVGHRVEDGFRNPRDQYERTQEEIRQALTIYHQELTRLSHLMPQSHSNSLNPFMANGNSFAGSLSQHHSNSMVAVTASNGNSHHSRHLPPQECPVDATIGNRTRTESKQSPRDEPELRHHGSAFSLVRPKTEPNTTPSTHNKTSPSSNSSYHDSSPAPPPLLPMSDANNAGTPSAGGNCGSEDLSTSASPLQRMQSITNSLLSQSSTPSLPNTPQRPAKAVLPPITQHQFDQYNNLNTEDIVKKVKEQLSQYSISQRLFGESVLGLSQGSVSDLLARPKPWHMLTQKGREPFIRMKIFLEDDNAVHKLVASQYKISPDKLLRTGGFGGATNPPGVLPQFIPNKMNARTPEPSPRVTDSRQSTPNNGIYTTSVQNTPSRTTCVTPDSLPMSLTVYTASSGINCISTNNGRKSSSGNRGYSQPSVYEMAALTTDLDTQTITSKIKETLMAHNIGQKIFGEVVLGLSQGSVSELLSKPKPWHMLSIKGREPFIRMQMWLNDPHNVEMLQTIKNERREANKRRRAGDGPTDSPKSHSDSQMYGYNFAPPSPYPPTKKPRVLFTEEQKEALRLAFNLDPYPSTATIEFLANELNLSVRTITNWFHNHRMRMKQHGGLLDDDQRKSANVSPNAAPVREGMGFDPIHYRVLLSQRLAEKFREKGGPPFLGNFGGNVPFLYSPYRNCSPLSSSGDDVGTLDLSMSSHLRNSVNSVSSKLDNAGSSTDDRSISEINDDSNLSPEPMTLSDRDSPDDNRNHQSNEPQNRISPNPVSLRQQQCRVQTSSSSNRRKPAMPQWVDPGLELSPDSDVHTDEDDDIDDATGEHEQIINGVCVRQTEDFDLMIPREETVHVMPVPAPDGILAQHKLSLKTRKHLTHRPLPANPIEPSSREVSDTEIAEDGEMTNGNDSVKDEDMEEDLYSSNKKRVDESKKVFSDDGDDDSWDDAAEAKDRRRNIEKLQQRLEKEDVSDAWEF